MTVARNHTCIYLVRAPAKSGRGTQICTRVHTHAHTCHQALRPGSVTPALNTRELKRLILPKAIIENNANYQPKRKSLHPRLLVILFAPRTACSMIVSQAWWKRFLPTLQVHRLGSQLASQPFYHRLRWAVDGRRLTAPLLWRCYDCVSHGILGVTTHTGTSCGGALCLLTLLVTIRKEKDLNHTKQRPKNVTKK